MTDNKFADLGTVAVLDPTELSPGNYIELDGQVCVVDRIVDQKVFLKIVRGPKLFTYRTKQFWNQRKVAIIVTLAALAFSILLHLYFPEYFAF